MKTLDELKEMLEEELKKITKKGDITPTELENAYRAVKTINYIGIIDAMKRQEEEGGYSQRGYSNNYSNAGGMSNHYPYMSMDGSYNSYGGSYDGMSHGSYGSYNSYDGRAGRDGDSDGRYSEDGGSYRRGRDARGRYTSRDGGSYEGGYSRHDSKEMMMKNLENMMNQATTEKERQAIRECMNELR